MIVCVLQDGFNANDISFSIDKRQRYVLPWPRRHSRPLRYLFSVWSSFVLLYRCICGQWKLVAVVNFYVFLSI